MEVPAVVEVVEKVEVEEKVEVVEKVEVGQELQIWQPEPGSALITAVAASGALLAVVLCQAALADPAQ